MGSRRRSLLVAVLLAVFILDVICAASRNHYEVLGVPRSASEADIRSKFKQLARTEHPDKSNRPDADERFAEIRAAYEVLSDGQKRRQYDQELQYGGTNPYYRQQQQRWNGDPEESSKSPKISKIRYQVFVEKMSGRSDPRFWALKIYSRYCGDCRAFSPVWEDFVSRISGMVQSARVYREEDNDLIQHLRVNFNPNYQAVLVLLDRGKIIHRRYLSNGITTSQLVDDVTEKFFDTVKLVYSKSDFQAFMKTKPELFHLIWVTDRVAVPNLMQRYLAREFRGKFVFGHAYSRKVDPYVRDILDFADGIPKIALASGEYSHVVFQSHEMSSDAKVMLQRLKDFRKSFFGQVTKTSIADCAKSSSVICVIAVSKNFASVQDLGYRVWKSFHSVVSISSDVRFLLADVSMHKKFVTQFELNSSLDSPLKFFALKGSQHYSEFNGNVASIEETEDVVAWIKRLISQEEKLYSMDKILLPSNIEEEAAVSSSFFSSLSFDFGLFSNMDVLEMVYPIFFMLVFLFMMLSRVF